jgi:hypothetical protein
MKPLVLLLIHPAAMFRLNLEQRFPSFHWFTAPSLSLINVRLICKKASVSLAAKPSAARPIRLADYERIKIGMNTTWLLAF